MNKTKETYTQHFCNIVVTLIKFDHKIISATSQCDVMLGENYQVSAVADGPRDSGQCTLKSYQLLHEI